MIVREGSREYELKFCTGCRSVVETPHADSNAWPGVAPRALLEPTGATFAQLPVADVDAVVKKLVREGVIWESRPGEYRRVQG